MCSKKEEQLTIKLIEYLQNINANVGDRLPSERNLAGHLNVSRNTLRSVVKMLQAQGVLEVKPGSGYYLKTTDNLDELLIPSSATDGKKRITEQLEAFFLFEPEAVALATVRMNDDSLKKLEECVIALSQAFLENNTERMTFHHKEFHQKISKGTGNRAIEQMLQRLELTYVLVSNVVSQISAEERNHIFARHVNIFNAIKERNPEQARKNSQDMIKTISQYLSHFEGVQLPKIIQDKLQQEKIDKNSAPFLPEEH